MDDVQLYACLGKVWNAGCRVEAWRLRSEGRLGKEQELAVAWSAARLRPPPIPA